MFVFKTIQNALIEVKPRIDGGTGNPIKGGQRARPSLVLQPKVFNKKDSTFIHNMKVFGGLFSTFYQLSP